MPVRTDENVTVTGAARPTPARKSGTKPALDIPRLSEAMHRSRNALEYFRTERLAAVQQYVGNHWSENGSDKKVPINLIARYIDVVLRNLVAKNPRVMFSTANRAAKPQAAVMQEWLNRYLEKAYFAETLQRWVLDALLSVGVMKVGIATPADATLRGHTQPVGVPFADVVDLDDFVFDLGARRFDEASFVGHRFRVPLEVARGLSYFDRRERKKLTATTNQTLNEAGDDRVTAMGRDYRLTDADEFEDMVDLWEVYLPRTRQVVTLAADDGGGPVSATEALRVADWVGPECGPYHVLAMGLVPGNAMPKSPVMDLVDLADLVNRLYRKLGNQAERQKEVLPVSGAAMDDSRRVKQAADGEMVAVDHPEGIKSVSYGGPNAVNVQFTMLSKDLFNVQAGNLDLLAGGGPQSKTAKQDELLNANAGAGVADKQEIVVTGTARVLRSFAWWWWNHPELVMTSEYSPPGVPEVSITRKLNPRGRPGMNRDVPFEELNLKVDPYSLQYRSPQQRLLILSETVKEMLPLMPLLQQQGIMFDANFYLKKRAEYTDEPDLVNLFTVQEPIAPQTPSDGQRMPSETSREYVRRSVGQDTQANRESEIENAFSAEAAESGRAE